MRGTLFFCGALFLSAVRRCQPLQNLRDPRSQRTNFLLLLEYHLTELGVGALKKGDPGLKLLKGFLIHERSVTLCSASPR
jgi:hypothetical protein